MKPNRLACAISIVGLLCAPAAVRAQVATGEKAGGGAGMLPPTIPIFPLQDVMLFPNISRPLLIFEPRYRAMVADALKGDRIIGMVLLRAGYEAEYEGRPPVHPIGCAGVITSFEQLPDGRYVIMLRGLVKFRVTSEDQTRPYRLARVEAMPEMPNDEQRAALRRQRPRLMTLLAEVVAPGSELPSPSLSDEELVNGIAQHLELDPLQRQDLLERNGPLSRSQALVDLLESKVTPPR
jgi:Lon protease-like protein